MASRASRDSAVTMRLVISLTLYHGFCSNIVHSMKRLKPVDVVIAGGGWTGLLMAKEITSRTSLSVVVLERGGAAARPPEYATKMDELDYNIRLRMMQNIADETVTHRHSRKDE